MGNAAQSAYDGLSVTPKILDAILVKNSQGQWFRFDMWVDRIFIVDRREEYHGWKDFDSGYIDNDIDELHEIYTALFNRPAPRNAVKITLTKAIYAKRFYMANDRSSTYTLGTPRDPVTGNKERKRSLDRRGYRAMEGESTVHLQNQALIVHRELLNLHKASNKEMLSEADIMDMMNRLRDTGVLKTKQDPFRIFQYYRPALIKAGKLEFIE